jgi:hypothetical protein
VAAGSLDPAGRDRRVLGCPSAALADVSPEDAGWRSLDLCSLGVCDSIVASASVLRAAGRRTLVACARKDFADALPIWQQTGGNCVVRLKVRALSVSAEVGGGVVLR